jgi:eukaryotic-like serine/threonine-protein kinase
MPDTTQFGDMGDSNGHFDGTLKPNTILLARYKIDAVLGGGGQGAVYRARDLNFPDAKRLVAVKEMLVTAPDANARAASVRMFQREANILATLAHPAIPKIFDFFEQNERAYLVQEYINGNDLEALMAKTKSLPMNKIIEWAIDLCDVLQYLHSYQPDPIIFRDMKPSNIMIDSLGKVRLIDFGIAKVFVNDPGKKHTTIGTEGYSAPEQYRGNANPSSDIYALGATLHHIISRRDPRLEPPFSFAERSLPELNPEATAEVAAVIDKALAFEAKDRWQNCADMKAALEAIRYGTNSRAVSGIVVPTAAGRPAVSAPAHAATDFFVGAEESIGTGVQPKWTFKTEDEIRGSPLVHRDIVYIGSYDSNLWAIKVEDGSFIWKRPTDGGVAVTPAISEDNKLVFFGSEDSTFTAVETREGRISWSYLTDDKIRSSPKAMHGHVFFGSDDGKLYALIQMNGRLAWVYDAASPVRGAPCVTNDRIIFGTMGGELVGLELSGTRKWSFRSRKPILSTPMVDSENVCYVSSMDNHLYALDAENGLSIWRVRTNNAVISSPYVERNMVYFGSTDCKFYCVNAQTGKSKWEFATEKPIVASPIVHEGVVYFGGSDKYLYALDAKNGKEIWKFAAKGEITGAPHIANNLVLFGSLDNTLYALPLVASS